MILAQQILGLLKNNRQNVNCHTSTVMVELRKGLRTRFRLVYRSLSAVEIPTLIRLVKITFSYVEDHAKT